MRRVVLDDNHSLTRYTEEPCRQHWTGIDQDIVQHDEYEAMASANVTNLDTKGKICRSLCSAVKEIELEGLCSKARALGLRVDQAWAAPRGQGFKAVAARFMVDSEEVLVVAFRSTFGSDEWIEYPQRCVLLVSHHRCTLYCLYRFRIVVLILHLFVGGVY